MSVRGGSQTARGRRVSGAYLQVKGLGIFYSLIDDVLLKIEVGIVYALKTHFPYVPVKWEDRSAYGCQAACR
ncbi:MAG: hypothetical protein ACE3JK_19170 [Sporolactobacillus sp.]